MWAHYKQLYQESNIEKAGPSANQALFLERAHRFAVETDIFIKNHKYKQVLECAASSAEDLAFWKGLPSHCGYIHLM